MDVFSEDTEPAVDRIWSKDRLHADINRAVGGLINLLREISRITSQYEVAPTLDRIFAPAAERMVKRTQFLSYELETYVSNQGFRKGSEAERLEALNKFFFELKQFTAQLDTPRGNFIDCAAYRLDRVLADRSGAPLVLELLYAFLAERIGIQLEFVDLKPDPTPRFFLRWNVNGVSKYIDITRRGAILSSDELIEVLHCHVHEPACSNEHVLETCSFESFVCDYVNAIKDHTDRGMEPERLLYLQDTLISYQPSNLALVGERAVLHRRLGSFKLALADLKRYFAFHDRSRAPADLVLLYNELLDVLER